MKEAMGILNLIRDEKPAATGKTLYIEREDTGLDAAPMLSSENTFVGYGINLIDGASFGEAITRQLLKDEVYGDALTKSKIDSVVLNSAEGTSAVGDTLDEAFSSLEIKAEVRTGSAVPFFSGGVKAKYGEKQSVKSQSKYYNSIFSVTTKKQTLNVLPTAIKNMLLPDELAYINDKDISPEDVFCEMGTHIILSDGIGGSININALYNSDEKVTSSELSVALDFKSSYVSGSASTDISKEQKKIANQTKIQISARGGNVGLLAGVAFAEIGPTIKAWGETVRVSSDQTIANIYKMKPIWEFADPPRQKELEEYFYSKAQAINALLRSYFTKSATPVTPAQNVIVDGGIYTFINFHSLKAIDVKEESKNREYLHLWDEIADHRSQEWVAIGHRAHPGYFFFKNKNSGLYMEMVVIRPGGKETSGTFLMQSSSNGLDEQLFKVRKNQNGTISLICKRFSESVLAGAGERHLNGTRIMIEKDNSHLNTQWEVRDR